MTPINRVREIKKLNICNNCLRPNHPEKCTGQCRKCGRSHNTLLHIESTFSNKNNQQGEGSSTHNAGQGVQSTQANFVQNNEPSHVQYQQTQSPVHKADENYFVGNSQDLQTVTEVPNNESVLTHCSELIVSNTVLLGTAMIYVKDHANTLIKCRALLDGGSQSNFISKELTEKLLLPVKQVQQPVIGVGGIYTTINESIDASIKSIHNDFTRKLKFLILDKITGNIPQTYQANLISYLKIPQNVNLADPEYNSSKPVDILLGASIFYELFSNGHIQIKLGKNKPILTKTKLGYVLAGPLQVHKQINSYQSCLLSMNDNNAQIQKSLERFWEIEHVQENKSTILTKEEQFCEDHFMQTHKRDHTGRYEVRLPLKDNYTQLTDNFQIAKKRLINMEHKMQKDESFSDLYKNFMKEYELLGHMTKLSADEISSSDTKYYMPHHGVFKASSETTKLRVVFDASSKEPGQISLNDALCVGPVIQEDLFSILVRFRKHNFVMKGDITKMYRQVNVCPENKNFQRILWRENPEQDISHFVLNTVTYGTSSASFLAIRSLQQVAMENRNKYPGASNVILSDFYVDDIISGADTQEKLQDLKNQISLILSSAGFILSQWMFNKDDNSQQRNVKFSDASDSPISTLGILWNPNQDTFQYATNLKYLSQNLTKRVLLSIVSQIFDPLGLIGPILIKAKILLQQLWKLHLDWDDPIPENIRNKFFEFCGDLRILCQISVSRHAVLSTYILLELHGFTDSSMYAYGVCIYLKTIDASGNSCCQLLCSKSRVSPIKVISLPRLELCGAVLLTRLIQKCIEALKINIVQSQIHLWTDSEIVLAWLSREPSTWKIFISNRVSEIQRNSEISSWHHVESADNPADIISRGCSPSFLLNCELWWSGPKWLKLSPQFWPIKSKFCTNFDNIPEKRNNDDVLCHISVGESENFDLLSRFSSLTTLVNVTAYCMRFIKNCKCQIFMRKTGKLSVQEVEEATLTLVKLIQNTHFAQEIKDIATKGQVSKNSKFISLSLFLENGILRVGGRLRNSKLEYDHKYPMLLPSKHDFTYLVIRHEHEKSLHGGIQTVLAAIRLKYWPINAKVNIKKIIRNCIVCFKIKPRSINPIMGQLPLSRVTPSRPFLSVGIDFAGPVQVKDGTLKTRKLVKTYICVFVCFCTKAVHLELVGDLSSNAFLCALKRFISRRGVSRNIYTDNGSNFTKSNKYLLEAYQKLENLYEDPSIKNYLLLNRVTWHFIPPRAPNFGGLWESAVKIMKRHLIRTIGDQHLTFENLYTVLCQIESVMNSRPLCPISNDPNDFNILTPGHFLIGSPMNAISEQDISSVPKNRLTKYEQVQQISSHFWKRWTHEYLHNLQQKTKWMLKDPQILKPGLMVMIHEDNLPPLHWKIGRISETHPGKDGEIRVVTVKTQNGTLVRAVNKISVLPIEQ